MTGECNGKMRSTPCPNDTFRTVNDARTPPRCMPMTMPSNTWMRSLSPSRTLTCTFTVSPACICGRSVICVFSTTSIAPMGDSLLRFHQLSQDFLLFHIQLRVGQQIRPPQQRQLERLTLAPFPNLAVMARNQHVGNFPLSKLRRPRVVRVVEKTPRKRITRDRVLVPNHSGNQPGDRIDDDKGRQFAPAQHVVADRQLLSGEILAHAIVDAFVSAAEHHDSIETGQAGCLNLSEAPSLGRYQND